MQHARQTERLCVWVRLSLSCVVSCVWPEGVCVCAHVWVASPGDGAFHAEGLSWGPGQLEGRKLTSDTPPPPALPEEKTSPFLREVQVGLIDFRKCNDYLVYDSYLTPRMLCAGDLRGGRDSCQVSCSGWGSGSGTQAMGEAEVLIRGESGPSFLHKAPPPLC